MTGYNEFMFGSTATQNISGDLIAIGKLIGILIIVYIIIAIMRKKIDGKRKKEATEENDCV